MLHKVNVEMLKKRSLIKVDNVSLRSVNRPVINALNQFESIKSSPLRCTDYTVPPVINTAFLRRS